MDGVEGGASKSPCCRESSSTLVPSVVINDWDGL
jgi:hypothetical protein